MAQFPATIPTERNTAGAEVLNAAGGIGLSGLLNEYSEEIVALATKLGTGSDTAATNEVLVGTGAGTSGWSATLAGLTLTAPVLSGSITGTYTLAGTPTLTSPTINTPTLNSAVIGTLLDMNGTELIFDADADTSLTADTDDQIDVKIAGADDFRFLANIFRALSGSVIETNTINETTAASGVTVDGLQIKDNTLVTVENVPILVNRQDNTSNNVMVDQLIQYGWGFVQGDNTNRVIAEAVTFPVAYDNVPVVIMQSLGAVTSLPDTIDDFTVSSLITGRASSITTSGFTATVQRISSDGADPGVLATGSYYSYGWVAIGTKAR